MKEQLINLSTELMFADLGITPSAIKNFKTQPDPDLVVRQEWNDFQGGDPDFLSYVPAQSLVARFIRETENLLIRVDWRETQKGEGHYCVSVLNMKQNKCIYNSEEKNIFFTTYEDAFETGIVEASVNAFF